VRLAGAAGETCLEILAEISTWERRDSDWPSSPFGNQLRGCCLVGSGSANSRGRGGSSCESDGSEAEKERRVEGRKGERWERELMGVVAWAAAVALAIVTHQRKLH